MVSYAEAIAAGRRLLGRGQASAAIGALLTAAAAQPAEAEPYTMMAEAYAAGGRWRLALAALDAALQRTTDRGPLYARRAAAHERLGDFAAAEADCGKALELLPGDPDVALRRAGLRWRGDPQGCLADLNLVLAAWPDSFEALASRGRLYGLQGCYGQAAADLAAALRRCPNADGVRALFRQVLADGLARCGAALRARPDDPAPYCERATFRQIAGDLPMALADLDRAAALDPASPLIRVQRAGLRRAAGDLAGALDDLAVALERDDRLAQAWLDRADLLERLGRSAEALDSLRRGLRLAPGSAAAWLQLGRTLLRAGQPEAALAALSRAVGLQPHAAEPRDERAAALAALGQPEAALADLLRAAQLRPSAERWYRCGLNRAICGQPDEALPLLGAALRLDPGHAAARSERGLLLMGRGDMAGAARDYAAAIVADPACYLAWTGRATLALGRGDYADAAEQASQAICLRPEEALAFHIRGRARLGTGEYACAAADLRQAIMLAPGSPMRGESQAILAQLAPRRAAALPVAMAMAA
jgi:tetratricopeptide (TPR) repeat protein